jgi:hypothetical protein
MNKINSVCRIENGGCGREIMFVMEVDLNRPKSYWSTSRKISYRKAIHVDEFNPDIHTVSDALQPNTKAQYRGWCEEKCRANKEFKLADAEKLKENDGRRV